MLKRLNEFLQARGGLAAVEFGLIAPLLVTMLLGSVEVTNMVMCDQKVESMASAASDLVAQKSSVSTSDVNDVFTATNTILYPYSTTTVSITITSIIQDPNNVNNAIVAWSNAQNATPHTVGTSMTVPAGLITAGGSVIYSEVRYSYTSPLTGLVTSTMTSNFYSKPRAAAQVAHT
jgi:Flp pilus assembly protein TadG